MIKLHFYKGPGRIGDKAIRFWTHRPHSHVEIEIDHIMYSADMWSNMVRSTRFYPDPDKWDTITLNTTPAQESILIEFLHAQLGKRYDWTGILLTQFIPLSRHHPERWFCSELVHAALVFASILPPSESHEIDPGELYEMVVKYVKETYPEDAIR